MLHFSYRLRLCVIYRQIWERISYEDALLVSRTTTIPRTLIASNHSAPEKQQSTTMASPSEERSEPFPALSPITSVPTDQPRPAQQDGDDSNRPATSSTATPPSAAVTSNANSRRRASSIRRSFLNSNPPLGMWQATGEVTSKVPSLAEIRNGSFAADGWNHEGQLERRGENPHEIHRKRLARTSSASTRTWGSSNVPTTPATPTIAERTSEDHGEARMYFPRRGSLALKEIPQEQDERKGSRSATATSPVVPEEQEHTGAATVPQQPLSIEYVVAISTDMTATSKLILTTSLALHPLRSPQCFQPPVSRLQTPRPNTPEPPVPTSLALIPTATVSQQSTPGGSRP